MKNKSSIDTGNNSFTMPDGAVLDLANKSPKEVINAYLAYKNRPSIDTKDHLDGEQAVTNLTPEQTKGLGDTPTKDHSHSGPWSKDCYACQALCMYCVGKKEVLTTDTSIENSGYWMEKCGYCKGEGSREAYDKYAADYVGGGMSGEPTPPAKASPSTPTALSSIDEILSQAFTDGASDTMWQNDRHVEIFATAKAKLEAYIEENYDAKN